MMTVKDIFNGTSIPASTATPTVADFFEGKNVFITGATGFMGKVLMEKLLWTCENIGNLYILVRPKKGHAPSKRIEDLLKLPVFDRLREKKPKCLSKIIPIVGDVMENGLGINDQDRSLLESSIAVVFHAAASVRFDDPLKKAIIMNVRGTREVVMLARNMKTLTALVYVSTSYCNCDQKVIEERVYPSNIDWNMMIKVAETINENTLNIIGPKIIHGKPNTYTFTKFLAENIINDFAAEIPSIIFRPSIVIHCMEEPTPGWVDNLNGPVALGIGIVTGILHVLLGDTNCLPDYMPCDRAINGLVVSAWYRGVNKSETCLVINGASGGEKNTSINFLSTIGFKTLSEIPPSRFLWYPSYVITTNKFVYYLMVLFTHIIPGAVIDIVLRLKGIKFSLMALYRKIYVASNALSYFLTNDWKILTTNYQLMSSFMTSSDQNIFKCNLDDLNEYEGIRTGAIGYKKYIFKDDLSEAALKKAKKNYNRMFWVDRTLKCLLLLLLGWFLCKFNMQYLLLVIFYLMYKMNYAQ